MAGIFTISLDFELHWGVFDVSDRDKRILNYEKTLLRTVPKMLELFSKYEAHATWATVGGMFATDKEDWESLNPLILPEFKNDGISIYKWVRRNGLEEQYNIAHFATNEIKNILAHPGQEVGSHLFSHMYCNEVINREDAFREDIKAAIKAGGKLGAEIASLTFPRNQIRQDLLSICYQEGIKAVRSNPTSWYFRKSRFAAIRAVKKVLRELDEYIPFGSSMLFSLKDIKRVVGEPIRIPRGRLFLPYKPTHKKFNSLRVKRMIAEIYAAAKKSKCCQLWWHPEDFSDYPEENLKNLESVLKAYKDCKDKYGMQSWNMGEYAKNLEVIQHNKANGRNLHNFA